MPNRRTKVIFIAGTDTDVGKTHVAALAVRYFCKIGLRVGVYKPVASGCYLNDGARVSDDASVLWDATGLGQSNRPPQSHSDVSLDDVCPQMFIAPLAPPEAAAAENTSVDQQAMMDGLDRWTTDDFDVCIVEGAGGLMSPIAGGLLNLDFAKSISPDQVILVAANRLGAIHQTLATIAASQHHNLKISGIVLNQASEDEHASCKTNKKHISNHCDVPVLAEVKFGDSELTLDINISL